MVFIKKKKNRDYAVSIVMYFVATGVYFLFAAILPAIGKAINPVAADAWLADAGNWYNIAYLPNISDFSDPFLNPFRMMTTINILLIIFPGPRP